MEVASIIGPVAAGAKLRKAFAAFGFSVFSCLDDDLAAKRLIQYCG
jgi:hypothetical protein